MSTKIISFEAEKVSRDFCFILFLGSYIEDIRKLGYCPSREEIERDLRDRRCPDRFIRQAMIELSPILWDEGASLAAEAPDERPDSLYGDFGLPYPNEQTGSPESDGQDQQAVEPIKHTIIGKYSSANIFTDAIGDKTMRLIDIFVNHRAISNIIAIMPNATTYNEKLVGLTAKLEGRIIPSMVGDDIGCGVDAFFFSCSNLISHLQEIGMRIRDEIPLGTDINDRPVMNFELDFGWGVLNRDVSEYTKLFNAFAGTNYDPPIYSFDWFVDKCGKLGIDVREAINAVRALGGGNHFIEIGRTAGKFSMMVHSGSGLVGSSISKFYQRQAASNECKDRDGSDSSLAPVLTFLDGDAAFDYLTDMIFAKWYAAVNRSYIMSKLQEIISKYTDIPRLSMRPIETVHNYIDSEDFIIRGGAIKARLGPRMPSIILLGQGQGSIICEGKSAPDWNFSAPNGAGPIKNPDEFIRRIQDTITVLGRVSPLMSINP